MRRAVLSMLAAGAALLLPGTASADNGGASMRDVYDAGRCMVDRDRRAAIGLLQALPLDGDAADLSSLPDSLAQRCGEGLQAASALHLRGAIAQALFFRDFGGFGVEPRRATPLVDLDLPVQRSPGGSPTIDLYRWADCLVRNDSHHAERLMESRVGSRTETLAIEGMRNYMAACAPDGAQLAVQAAELRSVIAQSAYHSMYRYWIGRLASVGQ